MAHFAYQAQCPNQTAISGVVEAEDFDAAMAQLTAMELQAVQLSETKPPKPARPIGSDDFIFFNEQLASLAATGICLDEGLRQVAADIESPRLRGVIRAIADEVQQGQPLDKAVAAHDTQLPVLYSRVVRAGIDSGQLPATLLNLSQHLRLLAEAKRVIIEALAYPLTALSLAVVIISFIMVFVVPKFEEIFRDFDTMLPGATLVLLSLARAFPALLTAAAAVVAALVATWAVMRVTGRGRRLRERLALAVPLVGSLIRSSLVARFSRSLALSVSSGVGLPEALRLAAGATGSPTLEGDAEALASAVEQGRAIRDASQTTKLIPPMFGFVIEIASGRNDLPEAMFQLAKAYELRALHSQSMLRSWLIPMAVIFVGGVIGSCIVALFLPLVSLINSVSGGM
ncbi:MAG: type II secretion system F family protein [Planctomycetota bacterium]|jgi:type IV pilus assembly protein PilC